MFGMSVMKKTILFAAIAAGAVANAQSFTLTSGNSVADFVFGSTGTGPMRNWSVNGSADQMWEQAYYLKVGNGPVRSLEDTIFARTVTQIGSDTLRARYFDANSGLEVLVNYYLNGSIGNTADMSEAVTINNLGNGPVGFSLFQYSDFDLAGNFPGDNANVLNSSTIGQADGAFNVTVGVTRIPQVRGVGAQGAVKNEVLAGSLTPLGPTFGPGDAAFAFQYIDEVRTGGAWQMSANKILVVPEPATMTALGLGVAALLRRRRK